MRRLILFDIDGTLVWGGPAKTAFVDALVETYGTPGDVERVSFAGKTDPQIARQLLAGAGLDAGAIAEGLEDLWRRYLGYLAERLLTDPVDVLPGVAVLLDALAEEADVALGLLTGNIAGGAQLKLGSAGLWGRFEVGSYGSDHEERDELPAIALRRARARWGDHIAASETIVVGDTPRDVQCGRVGGMKTVAVATGTFSAAQLRACEPDAVFEDFSDTEGVLTVLAG